LISVAIVATGLVAVSSHAQVGAGVASNGAAGQEILTRRALPVHDPSTIVRDGDTFWTFSTGVGISSSHSGDLVQWERGPAVLNPVPEWTQESIPKNRNGHFWAPDIIRLDGRFLLYYSVSSFGDNRSAIGLATNTTLDPDHPNCAWQDEGPVFQSFESDNYNAIDPALIPDQDDRLWMSFGSFWGGIQMIELDRDTGKRIAPDSTIHSLARNPEIEAPFIYFSDGFYYLFVNWDRCCRGLDSTYNIRVGRSESITGPYLDKAGVDMRDQGGSLLIGTEGNFIGPGHPGIFSYHGADWFTVHFYDGATENGTSMFGMAQIQWQDDGWPIVVAARPREGQ
jgi:arabinan endo-1,5-alpha-L-arabinosidase